jgi:predicted O-methyltransferase YrrM
VAKAAYPACLDWAVEHVRRGGLIMGHNAFMRGRVIDPAHRHDEAVQHMMAFTRRMAGDPRLMGTVIPVGDGIAVAVRR